jgi:hypothetical protein
MNHWTCEGNSLILIFSYSLGLVEGSALDGM